MVVSPLIVGVQCVHRLVVADTLGEVVVVGHLHLNVVTVIMVIGGSDIEADPLGIVGGGDCLLGTWRGDPGDRQVRQNVLDDRQADRRIGHHLAEDEVVF